MIFKQVSNSLLMVRPTAFRYNEETAVNNYYQQDTDQNPEQVRQLAIDQFDKFVALLRAEGVDVTVIDSLETTPDAVFPNNWISFHENGSIVKYPMYAENRRLERRNDIVDLLNEKFQIVHSADFSHWERKHQYLEGTGSIILDRENRIAYAAISERTDREVLDEWASVTGYQTVIFHAYQSVGNERKPIYHTNVMMWIGEKVAVICADSIDNENERRFIMNSLRGCDKDVITITEEQVNQFAGNMLQVEGSNGNLIVMSTSAYNSLKLDQKTVLNTHGKMIHSDLSIIEQLGGGSARCMMAEVFLPIRG
ncbi:MAG: amidinotransferase [Cyclobacteriaceae bacterium]